MKPRRAILSILLPPPQKSQGNITGSILTALECARREEIDCVAVVMRTKSGDILTSYTMAEGINLSTMVGCVEFLQKRIVDLWLYSK